MKYNPAIVTAYYLDCGLPEPTYEHRFSTTRKWRFDIFFPEANLAVEVQGAVWTGGRHSRGKGIKGDIEKHTAAQRMGYRIVYTTPDELCMSEFVDALKDIMTWKVVSA